MATGCYEDRVKGRKGKMIREDISEVTFEKNPHENEGMSQEYLGGMHFPVWWKELEVTGAERKSVCVVGNKIIT